MRTDLLRVLGDHEHELEVVHSEGDIEQLVDVGPAGAGDRKRKGQRWMARGTA